MQISRRNSGQDQSSSKRERYQTINYLNGPEASVPKGASGIADQQALAESFMASSVPHKTGATAVSTFRGSNPLLDRSTRSHMSTPMPLQTSSDIYKVIVPLAAVTFLGFCSIGIPLPAIPIEVSERMGYGSLVVGCALGLQSLVTVCTRQFAGRITDTLGAKQTVLIGLPFAGISGLLYMGSSGLENPALSLSLLFLGRAFLGLAESMFLTGAMTWGIAHLGLTYAGRVMAWQGIAMFLALSIGGPIGMLVHESYGFRGIGAISFLVPLIGATVAFLLPAPAKTHGQRTPFGQVLTLIWRHGVALLLAGVPYATLIGYVTLTFRERGWEGGGYALSAFGFAYVAMRMFFADLPNRLGSIPVVAASLFIEAIGMIILAVASHPILAFSGAVLIGLGFSLVFPSLGAEAIKAVRTNDRGSAIGGFSAFIDLSLGVTGPLMGVLLTFGGFATIYSVGAICALSALGLTLTIRSPKAQISDP